MDLQNKRIKTAIFPVGGFGTRFLPSTKAVPKEMLPVANKPIIQHAFEEAKSVGVEKFIFITGRNKYAINNHFDRSYEIEDNLKNNNKLEQLKLLSDWLPSNPGNIIFISQEKPNGLGHAIYCARNFVNNEPFIVILPDELIMEQTQGNFLQQMVGLHSKKQEKCNIISVVEIDKNKSNQYGIISVEGQDKITDLVEKPAIEEAPSNLAINGRYIFEPEIFQHLEAIKPDKNNEIQITDAIKLMLQNLPSYYSKYLGKRFDCGNYDGYLKANIAYALAKDGNLKQEILATINA